MENIIITSIVVIIPIIVTLILRKIDQNKEHKKIIQRKIEQQKKVEQQRLSLDIADDILYDHEKLYIKVTNVSPNANASNIIIDMRIEDRKGLTIAEMKPIELGRRQLLSQAQAREQSDREVVIVFDSKHILPEKNLPDNNVKPIKFIRDIVENGNVIKVKMQAVNMELGTTIFFRLKVFRDENIKYGTFVEGINTIQRPNNPMYIDHETIDH